MQQRTEPMAAFRFTKCCFAFRIKKKTEKIVTIETKLVYIKFYF